MRVCPSGITVSFHSFHCNQLKAHKASHKTTIHDICTYVPLSKGWRKSTVFNGL